MSATKRKRASQQGGAAQPAGRARELGREVFSLFLVAITALLFLSIYSQGLILHRGSGENVCGIVGQLVGGFALETIGTLSSYFLVIICAVWAIASFFRIEVIRWPWKVIGAVLLGLSLAILDWLLDDTVAQRFPLAGGVFGTKMGQLLQEAFSRLGTYLVAGFAGLVGLVLCTDMLISRFVAFVLGHGSAAAVAAGRRVPGLIEDLRSRRQERGWRKRDEARKAKAAAAAATKAGSAKLPDGDDEDDVDDDEESIRLVPREGTKLGPVAVEPKVERVPYGSPKEPPEATIGEAFPAAESGKRGKSKRKGGGVGEQPLPAPDGSDGGVVDGDAHGSDPWVSGDEDPEDTELDATDAADDLDAFGEPEFEEHELPEPEVVKPERKIKIVGLEPSPPAFEVDETQLTLQGCYSLPSLSLLSDPPVVSHQESREELEQVAEKIEQTLASFKIEARVGHIQRGPVITQYEITLGPGIKVHKIVSLADDLAMALSARSIRVVAPIPGKSAVGIEVPNRTREVVNLKDLLQSRQYRESELRIPILLGKDAAGEPIIEDLARMPHLLIAGSTGSGKSVCINSIIASFLMTRTPDDLKLILVDPKMVELSSFEDIPHLLTPVITDMKKAPAALEWLVRKMDQRYDLMSKAEVRHIDDYNVLERQVRYDRLAAKVGHEEAEKSPDRLPFIVIIIDELADLMMTNAKDIESSIIRLCQKSRAVGIHVILATQRPSVDVITGLIKSNLPCRISFRVASRVDARTIMDGTGAERLLGQGDMLFLAPGASNLNRAQSTFISDKDIRKVVRFLKKEAAPQFSQEIQGYLDGGGPLIPDAGDSVSDDLFDQAVRVILETQRGSASLLQRRLGIGYTRASRLMDLMAEQGIVGSYKGSKAREVVMTLDEWEAQRN
ncbi:MAG: DNA translocase FtsK [Planctomycetota bacterium]